MAPQRYRFHMKIQIKSDGTMAGTSVTNVETGEPILCTRIELVLEAEHVTKAVLYLDHHVELDVVADGEVRGT